WVYRSFNAAGKIQRYEISVVEIAMVSTTLNAFAVLWCLSNSIAAMQKADDVTPERTFTRTGVPNRRLKIPKNGANAPSYAATAWIRSDPIIHTAPEVTSAPTKQSVMMTSSA